MNLHALVIVADAKERDIVRRVLHQQQWKVREAPSVEEAEAVIDRSPWSLIICDAALCARRARPQGDVTWLSELKSRSGTQAQIVVAAAAGEGLVSPLEAILNGASDYILKPFGEEEIAECSRRVIERLRAADREAQLARRPRAPDANPRLPELVGESRAIVGVFKELALIVRNIYLDGVGEGGAGKRPPSVFITGETGTGKELVARIIHRRGPLSKGEFVPVNCGNLTPELAESELFGHEAGAFTGATRRRQGLWELADGGTLFLDEITEAPPSVLPRLLRVLQDGVVKRLGSNRTRQTDVQVIAASNRDIRDEIREGRFRSDLYHRLSLHRLHLPPLRERLEDVPLIVEYFTKRHFRRDIRFAQDALDMLKSYPFPGNVRELENVVCGAARRSPDGVVYAVDLSAYIETRDAGSESNQRDLKTLSASIAGDETVAFPPSSGEGLDERIHRFKLRVVRETLEKCGGNVTRAAQALKISRPSLYRLMKELEGESDAGRRHPHDLRENRISFPVATNRATVMN